MSEFFAIDKRTFAQACDISINSAVAYLVLACGTGKSNMATSWSVNAIEKYTQISRQRAKKAVEILIAQNLITRTRGGTKPRYQLPIQTEKGKVIDGIWLPNSVVVGASGEASPIERIRQTQDAMCLRLFIEMYGNQNLAEDGGISRAMMYGAYERVWLADVGEYSIFGFTQMNVFAKWDDPVTDAHRRNDLPEGEQGTDFFRRQRQLLDLGLMYWVPHLFDSEGDEAEIIHALDGEEDIEQELGLIAHEAGLHMLDECYQTRAEDFDFVLPIKRHFKKAAVIGIARLRYRPRTKLTGAWWARLQNESDFHHQSYRTIYGHEQNMQHQGDIKGISRGYQGKVGTTSDAIRGYATSRGYQGKVGTTAISKKKWKSAINRRFDHD